MSGSDDNLFNPAQVDGSQNVYGVSDFTFLKPRWIEDAAVSSCFKCVSKFTQLRRRHHCRQCGRIFCSKCCYEKVALPHLGCNVPERICQTCRPVTELLSKARSSNASVRLDAAEGLAAACKNPETVLLVVELGGLQTLVFLADDDDDRLKAAVASGLHYLSTYVGLHQDLADAGAMKALCSMLCSADEEFVLLLSDGASALRIFCKSPQLRQRVVKDGAIGAVMKLCSNSDDAIALLGVSTLSLIVEDASTHNAVVFHSEAALPRLLELTVSFDEQMQEVALRTLCFLSQGSQENCNRIWQLDCSCGHYLLTALQSRPENLQILRDVTCLIANLAAKSHVQDINPLLVSSLVKMLAEFEPAEDLSSHASRALANLANSNAKSDLLLEQMPNIVTLGLHSQHASVRSQSIRFITNLLISSAGKTITSLSREGSVQYLRELVDVPNLMKTISNHLQKVAPTVANPVL